MSWCTIPRTEEEEDDDDDGVPLSKLGYLADKYTTAKA